MRAYHFISMTHGISNLSLRRLKVSRIGELNDPFELLAADLSDPKDFNAFEAFKGQLDKEKGLLCFSGSWSNPLLWGHYADRHFGMALGFDIPDDKIIKVNYTSTRARVRFDMVTGKVVNGDHVIDRIIRTKYSDWAYEDEYRVFFDLDSQTKEGGLHFVDFSAELLLREVIIGMRCELPLQRIRQLLGSDFASVRVTKAGMASRTFGVVDARRSGKAPT